MVVSAKAIYRQLETIAGSSDYFRLADYPDGGNSNAFLATVQSDLHELV